MENKIENEMEAIVEGAYRVEGFGIRVAGPAVKIAEADGFAREGGQDAPSIRALTAGLCFQPEMCSMTLKPKPWGALA